MIIFHYFIYLSKFQYADITFSSKSIKFNTQNYAIRDNEKQLAVRKYG